MEIAVAVVIVIGAAVVSARLLTGWRRRLEPEGQKPKRMSRRERLRQEIEELRANVNLPTVYDLMMQEAAETGVNEIAGGEELPIPTKLKVWRRDAAAHGEGVDRSTLRFELVTDVAPADADVDDVHLVSARSEAGEPEASEPAAD